MMSVIWVIIISVQISITLNNSRQYKEYRICENTFNQLSKILMKKKLSLAKVI